MSHLGLEAMMMFFFFFQFFSFFRCQIFFNFHPLLSIDDAPLRCGTIYGVIRAIKIPIQLHLNLNHAIDDDNNTQICFSRTLNFDQIIFSLLIFILMSVCDMKCKNTFIHIICGRNNRLVTRKYPLN